MDDLALQVGDVDLVVVDQAQRADAGRRQIHQHRRAQPAGPDHQDTRLQQFDLPFLADLVHDDVAGVTVQAFLGDFHG